MESGVHAGSARPDPDAVRRAPTTPTTPQTRPRRRSTGRRLRRRDRPSRPPQRPASRPRRAGGGPAGRPERRAGGRRRSRRRRWTSRLRTQRRTTPHRRRWSVTTAGPAAPVSGPGPPPGRSPPPDRTARIATCPRRPLPTRRSPTRPGRTAGRTAPSRRCRRRPACTADRAEHDTAAHRRGVRGLEGRPRTGRPHTPRRAAGDGTDQGDASPFGLDDPSTLRPRRAVSGRPGRRRRPVRRERARDLRAGRSAAVAAAARGGPARSGRHDRDHTDLRRDRVRLVRLGPPGPGRLGAGRAARRRPAPGERAGPAAHGPGCSTVRRVRPRRRHLPPRRRPATDPAGQSFATIADEGWRAASGATAERPDELTAAGLPKRRPRARLVPGSAGSAVLAAPASPTRSAESVRGRLASYQQGVRQGREIRLRRDPVRSGSQPESPGDDTAGSGERRARRGNPMTGPTGPVHTAPAGSSPARCSKEGA